MIYTIKPDESTSGSNAINIINYDGISGVTHLIHQVAFSYSGTPTGGRLFIEDGGVVIFDVDITTGGPGPISFGDYPIAGTQGNPMRVIMSAAGSVVSKLTCWHSRR